MQEDCERFVQACRALLGPAVFIDPNTVPYEEISDPEKLCKDPVVSIHCLAYNHEKYIERAFQGFEEQVVNFPYEIVIGEDCSTDRTLELCKAFQQKHPDKVRIITLNKNVGATANSLRCKNLERGKYIAFCEGDDFWCSPTKLQEQVEFLEEHPKCAMVHANARIILEDEDHVVGFSHDRNDELFLMSEINHSEQYVRGKIHTATASAMVRRILLQNLVRDFPDLYCRKRLLGDVPMWVGCGMQGDVHYSPHVLSVYRRNVNSITGIRKMDVRLRFCLDGLETLFLCYKMLGMNDSDELTRFEKKYIPAMLFPAYVAKRQDVLAIALDYCIQRGWKKEFPMVAIIGLAARLRLPVNVLRVLLRLRCKN